MCKELWATTHTCRGGVDTRTLRCGHTCSWGGQGGKGPEGLFSLGQAPHAPGVPYLTQYLCKQAALSALCFLYRET